jgi:putative ABC transport system substrate-binding protein
MGSKTTQMTQVGHRQPKFAVMHNAILVKRCGRVQTSALVEPMRRREIITLIGAAAAWPLAARAQQKKLPIIGFLGSSTFSATRDRIAAFLHRLHELGWIESQTIAIEYRWAEGRAERLDDIAAEFVRLKVDVIVTSGAAAVVAAKAATPTIPIVFTVASDPVGTGLVTSLARPGGNVTGMSYEGPDLSTKRIGLLREVVGSFSRLAIIANSGAAGAMREMHEVEAASGSFGLEVLPFVIQRPQDIASAFISINGHAQALYVCADPLVNTNRTTIIALGSDVRLPTIFGERENVEEGGLISYGPHIPDLYRRAAELVDKILRGTTPSEIPVEQPTKFELVLNLKTAKLLNLAIPESFLRRADEVIE